jgi:glycosyltransferase involved in cell wall biosynthesis
MTARGVGAYCSTFRHLGGGEKYLLTMARALAESGRPVELVTGEPVEPNVLAARYNLDLSSVTLRVILPHVFRPKPRIVGSLPPFRIINHLIEDGRSAAFSSEYDVFINICNTIPVKNRARRGVLIIQFPFPEERVPFDWRRHLATYGTKVCYSRFAQGWIRRRWGVDAAILAPPVERFAPGAKANTILSVGRFFSVGHGKKHQVMIEAFKKLIERGLTGWELHLAGSVNDPAYYRQLEKDAAGSPVHFHPDCPHAALAALYGRAKIYWHATGFDEDQERYPERMEHFGMTTVEAMSAGCVPLAFNAGGQPEIISDGENGFIWDDIDELLRKTTALIDDETRRGAIASQARGSAKRYDYERFRSGVLALAERP